jgi:hypothetical protein
VCGSECAQIYGFGRERIRAMASVGAHGRQVAVVGRQRQREVAGGGQATVVTPRAHGRVLAGTCGHGLSCATSKRALPLKLFPKFQNWHKICNSNW